MGDAGRPRRSPPASLIVCSHAVETIDADRASFAAMFALDAFSIFFKLLFIAAIAHARAALRRLPRRVALLAVGVLLAARASRSAA